MINEIEEKKSIACGKHCIKINNITVKYGSDTILNDVSLHMHCGTLTVLVGPNGAGKSTLLKAILGEIRHKGNITFRNIEDNTIQKMVVGYVPQSLNIERDIPITVYDFFASCISIFPVWFKKSKKLYNKIYNQLKIFSIEDCIDKQLGKLSGGQLQRVLLCVAITPMPNLLILDEPVSGIDKNGVQDFYRLVNEIKVNNDIAILLVSHDLNMVKKYADNVVLLNRTILCEGNPDYVYNNEEFKKIFN